MLKCVARLPFPISFPAHTYTFICMCEIKIAVRPSPHPSPSTTENDVLIPHTKQKTNDNTLQENQTRERTVPMVVVPLLLHNHL
jgi:hypothetical protein